MKTDNCKTKDEQLHVRELKIRIATLIILTLVASITKLYQDLIREKLFIDPCIIIKQTILNMLL